METFNRVRNGLYMLAGSVGAFIGVKLLIHHQYVIGSWRGSRWTPTVIFIFMGLWLFMLGLLGFIRRKPGE